MAELESISGNSRALSSRGGLPRHHLWRANFPRKITLPIEAKVPVPRSATQGCTLPHLRGTKTFPHKSLFHQQQPILHLISFYPNPPSTLTCSRSEELSKSLPQPLTTAVIGSSTFQTGIFVASLITLSIP